MTGGYHIQADYVAGLQLGRDVARHIWPKIQGYFDGAAKPVMEMQAVAGK